MDTEVVGSVCHSNVGNLDSFIRDNFEECLLVTCNRDLEEYPPPSLTSLI
jgi:hypothetical protein